MFRFLILAQNEFINQLICILENKIVAKIHQFKNSIVESKINGCVKALTETAIGNDIGKKYN